MDDALVVRGPEAGHDLPGVVEALRLRQRPRFEPLAQGLALQQLRHHVVEVAVAPDVEHGQEVRMGEGGGRARLALEAPRFVAATAARASRTLIATSRRRRGSCAR